MGTSHLGILTLPRLLAVEVLLAEPEALQDDVLESCLYIFARAAAGQRRRWLASIFRTRDVLA
jgi:hypothetical protein